MRPYPSRQKIQSRSQTRKSPSIFKKESTTSLMATVYAFLYLKQIKKRRSKSNYRKKILDEWSKTEAAYLNDLNISLRHIKAPMIKNNVINEEDSRILFPEFESMVPLSTMMVDIIEEAERTSNPNKILIGSKIQKIASGFKIYGTYFGYLLKTQKMLADLSRQNQSQMKQIENNLQSEVKKKDPTKAGRTINEYMTQPQQRVFKYQLLLKQYLKKLPPYHPDYQHTKQAEQIFCMINQSNNQLMASLEEQQERVKLHELFGGALKEGRTLLGKMLANTIYFDGKIYIFNDLIIITKIQSILGTEKEEKHMDMELNQFSYIGLQEDMKYFKDLLVLIGVEQCIHFQFPDKGSRNQLYRKIQKILKDLRVKAYERRKIDGAQKNHTGNKIKFTLANQTTNNVAFEPEFRIQILGFEVRPLSSLSNDTAYVTRFMLPLYQQDQVNFLQSEGLLNSKNGVISPTKLKRYSKLPFSQLQPQNNETEPILQINNEYKAINQRVECHFSVLAEMYKQMCTLCNQKIPNIDPVTKDVNIYSKGKNKTRSFEMRKFFIEEFFNFVFRQPDILKSPIKFIKRLRINQSFWNYVTERNSIQKRDEQKNENKYGYDHCQVCKKGKIRSLEEFEHYRSYYTTQKRHRQNKALEKYCFNFFNLVRMRLLSFKYLSFTNLERVLTYYHYLEGRLDYPFLPHVNSDKMVKVIKIYLPSLDDDSVSVSIDSTSTAGEVIDEICRDFEIKIGFDYELIALYNGKSRIMDRDQFVADIVNVLQIEYEEISADKNISVETKAGFFTSIKKWKNQLFSSDQKNKIYLMKATYLYKSLQVKTFMLNPQKRRMEVERIFWEIRRGHLRLNEQQMIQIAGLFYCLKDLDAIEHFSLSKMSIKILQKIIPNEYGPQLDKASFRKEIAIIIDGQKQFLQKNKKMTENIHQRVIEIVAEKTEYFTYYMAAEVREIPQGVIQGAVPVTCNIGINYKEFIMTRSEMSTTPLVRLNINEFKFTNSVFSVFLHHQKGTFRFDSKMLYHFCELIRKYQLINQHFPQH